MKTLVIKKDYVLKPNMYKDQKYDEIIIEEGVKEIPYSCFEGCGASKVSLPSTIEKMEYRAFSCNAFKTIDLSNTKLTRIEMECFYDCGIEKVLLPKKLKTLDVSAFNKNNLVTIDLPDSVETLNSFCFDGNPLQELNIPKKVTNIGRIIVDSSVPINYKGRTFDSEFLNKFGTESIIKYLGILSLNIVTEEALNNFPKEAIRYLKIDKEDIKGFVINYKLYKEVIKNIETELKGFDKEWYISSIFKMCYVLGLFNKPDSETFIIIKEMVSNFTPEEMKKRWDLLLDKTRPYNPKFKELFVKTYLNNPDDLYSSNMDITKMIYRNFSTLKKEIYNSKNVLLMKKQKELRKVSKNSNEHKKLEEEINELKKTLKVMNIDDIKRYFESVDLKIREGNERLSEILAGISMSVSKRDFDRLQDIYEKGKDIVKLLPLVEDKQEAGFTYKWTKSDDPINFLLGNIMSCCAVFGGGGEDIMVQSVINPNVTNLIIYDENKKIVGKATSYFNPEKKYILFNNFETKQIGSKGLKSAEERKKELLNAILRACDDLVDALKKKGIDIERIAVGLNANDLQEELESDFEVTKTDLLEQYQWNGYKGDAGVDKGQAIIYRDLEEESRKKI